MHFWNQEEREENKKKFQTAPYDPRFPSTNQAKRCFINYVDYWKCAKVNGEENPICQEFKYVFSEICPPFWVESWDEQKAAGRHPVREINEVDPKF
ncbi:hypothetical protein MIR68_008036 [Amoeboaphelidium protococcarum]|nr:hypothetical protein MIR68_011690 [Amoeboaphelidium protococcarum]KAI3634432.1 hypothetical protein MIR68_008036 [Amoeboaphelidium protococcarum]KAI3649028.1 hypothetical protein MP228_006882 [Amoeboaphelidium protococcarum]KAI3652002.1 hypothetical protein MP228_003305 [Amoeboaphelidium protococcarum]